jgi:hypothetical protein
MKKVHRILLTEYLICVGLSLIAVVLYENEVLLPGVAADRTSEQYVCQIIMELLTLAVIPSSLYLFKLKRVSAQLKADGARALKRWGSLRMLALGLPMVVNTLLYYRFMNVAFGYMGIVLFLSLFFVFPSKARCIMETES